MSISRRQFTQEMRNWIGYYTGVGPGVGKIFHVATASSAYETLLKERGFNTSEIFDTIAEGYAACTASRHDVVCIWPGTYTVTASLAWAKSQTHLVGMGGPNQRYGPTTATTGDVKIYCATASVDSILSITGHHVQLRNFQTQNTYSDNANRCDIQIAGKNTYMNGVHARGGNGANQLNHADGGVPLIVSSGTAGYGNGFLAENCIFGTSGNSARTVGAGAVLFEGGAAAGFNPVFRHCTLEMRCETSGSSDPKLVHLAADYAVDRMLLFDNCVFYSMWENMGGKVDYAIVDDCATTHSIVLRQSTMVGIDFWCNVNTYCFTDIAEATDQGGEVYAVKVS